MRLYDEIFKKADGNAFQSCTIVPLGGGYFEGVKSVGDFSPERVVLYFPRVGVEVEGSSLSIAKYFEGDLQLSGKITRVSVLNEEENSSSGR